MATSDNFRIVGLSGKPGSRKDTLALAFIGHIRCKLGIQGESLSYYRISLGDQIRRVAAAISGIGVPQLASHPFKDEYNVPWFNMTPRKLTIEAGKAIEGHFGVGIWEYMAERMMHAIQEVHCKDYAFICTDIRTPHQADWIKKHGGLLIRLDNGVGELPEPIENMLDNYDGFDLVYPTEKIALDPEVTANELRRHVYNNKLLLSKQRFIL